MSLTGQFRTKQIKVSKYSAGVIAAGYPKYYYITGGGTTYTYNGSAVSEEYLATLPDGAIGSVPSYFDLLDDFKTWVEAAETGLDIDLTQSNQAYGEDAESCPIGNEPYATVFATGENSNGQLGQGDTTDRDELDNVVLANIRRADAGNNHSGAINSDGDLYMWGLNTSYQLGDGTVTQRDSPVQIGTNTWEIISCGNTHSAGIDTDGFLWTWGSGANGKLGNGATTDETTPYKVGTNTWRWVSCGSGHTLAIRSDGTLWACGDNSNGQLGDGTTTQRTSLVQIGIDFWYKVDAGNLHSIGITAKGELYTWGDGSFGKLGLGTDTSDKTSPFLATDIPCLDCGAGHSHSIALSVYRYVLTTGLNANGQLGNGTTTSQYAFNRTGDTNTLFVAAGSYHSLLIKPSGLSDGLNRPYATGFNGSGQLGTGDTTQRNSFTEMEYENILPYYDGLSVSGGNNHSLYVRYEGLAP